MQQEELPGPPDTSKDSDNNSFFLGLQYRYWWFIVLNMILTIIVFNFGCLGAKKWARQGEDISEWEGGLLYCNQCYSEWDEEHYNDVASDMSDLEGDLAEAMKTTFENLRDAGSVFVFFELTALIMNLLWIARVVFILMERKLGPNWLGFVPVAAGFVMHTVGLIAWTGIADAGFEADCEELNDGSDRRKVCSTYGAGLAVITCILYIFFGAFYVFLYINRGRVAKEM
jgi:hypothetical protein